MSDHLLAIECLKVAAQVVSPSVADRAKAVAETTTLLYAHVNALLNQGAEKPKLGRPPKPRD